MQGKKNRSPILITDSNIFYWSKLVENPLSPDNTSVLASSLISVEGQLLFYIWEKSSPKEQNQAATFLPSSARKKLQQALVSRLFPANFDFLAPFGFIMRHVSIVVNSCPTLGILWRQTHLTYGRREYACEQSSNQGKHIRGIQTIPKKNSSGSGCVSKSYLLERRRYRKKARIFQPRTVFLMPKPVKVYLRFELFQNVCGYVSFNSEMYLSTRAGHVSCVSHCSIATCLVCFHLNKFLRCPDRLLNRRLRITWRGRRFWCFFGLTFFRTGDNHLPPL